MKKLHLILTVVCFILLTGCGSDDNASPKSKINGIWEAYLYIENNQEYSMETEEWVLEFKTNGTLVDINKGRSRVGTYEVDEDVLTINLQDRSYTYRILQLESQKLKLDQMNGRQWAYKRIQ